MPRAGKDAILAALPALSRPDLEAVQAVVGHLLGQRPKNVPAATPDKPEAWLYDAICATLSLRLSFEAMANSDSYKQWKKHAPEAVSFIEINFEEALRKQVTALALMRFLVGLIAADLKKRQAPVTMGSIIVNLGRLPEVFENSFPNYLASGAASLVLLSIKGA